MPARDDDLLRIKEHPDHVDIEVLKTCDIRWSEDTTIWNSMGSFQAGTVLTDHYRPERPRSYMANVDQGPWQTYYSREAGRAFAELMEPWFPSGHQR
jgi:hypothetical protein